MRTWLTGATTKRRPTTPTSYSPSVSPTRRPRLSARRSGPSPNGAGDPSHPSDHHQKDRSARGLPSATPLTTPSHVVPPGLYHARARKGHGSERSTAKSRDTLAVRAQQRHARPERKAGAEPHRQDCCPKSPRARPASGPPVRSRRNALPAARSGSGGGRRPSTARTSKRVPGPAIQKRCHTWLSGIAAISDLSRALPAGVESLARNARSGPPRLGRSAGACCSPDCRRGRQA
jgi:hypothetical protein